MTDRPPSWKDRLHRSPKSSFIGRTVQLQAFRSTLATPLDERTTLLFNISGQGGIGKTTLLKQFRKIAEELQQVAAYVDEGSATNAIDTVPEALSRLALDLEKQGYEFKEFQKQYKTYRQKKQELEADPDAPTGLAAGMGKFMTKAGLGMAKSLPGGGMLDVLDADGLAHHAGEWAGFVARKLTNKDEVQLVQEPIEVLTPLFLADLNRIAAKKTVVLLLDTYEQTGAFWQDWLLAVLDDRFAESFHPNCLLAIAGREPLERNAWVGWEEVIVRSELEPFSRSEAEQYLASQGVTATAVVEEIWRLSSGGLPVLIGMMAQNAPDTVAAVSDACEDAVERFLKWEKDEAQRKLALQAALPRVLNQDVLAVLQGAEEGERLFGWLKSRSFVVQHPDGWQYHAIVREQMLRYQRRLSLATWERLHGQLAAFYDDRRQKLGLAEQAQWQDEVWQNYTLEWLYHSLCEAPQRQIGMALNGWLAALKHSRTLAQEWAEAMMEAGDLTIFTEVKRWGDRLLEGLVAVEDKSFNSGIAILSDLLKDSRIELKYHAGALNIRGSWYQQSDRHELAISDFRAAIALVPDGSEYWWGLGLSFQRTKRYEEAISAYQRANNLYQKNAALPNDLDIFYFFLNLYLSRLCWEQKRYDEAISACNRAIELYPEDASPHNYLGVVYEKQKRYDDAISAYQRAIEINSTYAAPRKNLGILYQEQKRYEEAISLYHRAIELDPKDADPHSALGDIYCNLNRYEDAENAYHRAAKLNPTWAIPHNDLGNLYREQKRYEEAISAYQKAIVIDPQYKYAFVNLGETHCLLGRYAEAIQLCDLALEIDANYDWAILGRGYACLLMRRYDLAIQDFDEAIALDPEDDWYFYCRAIAHLALNHPGAADTDIVRAIDLAQTKSDQAPTDWRNTFNLALYHLVADHFDPAETLYRNAKVEASRDRIEIAQRDLQDFLSLFPDHAIAQQMVTLLQVGTES